MRSVLFSVGLIFLWGWAVDTAKADLINFKAQGAGSGNDFNFIPDSPLVIGLATFTGGQLLLDEIDSVDETAVYATAFGSPYSDPLTITFSTPVNAFSIRVTNEIGDTYTVTDNLGGSTSAFVGTNKNHAFHLSDTGITSVTIGNSSADNFDFAIDNVRFTPSASAVPEPSGVLPVVSALGISVLLARLAKRKGLTQL